MRFRGLFIICIIISSLSAFIVSPVEGASESFVEGPHEFYIVKEVIEVTSDWQDITWTQGPEVYSIRYTVVEGAEAIEDIEVSGLTVWVTQKSLDTVKVVLEIEALVLKGDETAQVSVRKGAIGYANVELMVYDASSGSFSGVTEFHSSMESLDFEFDASSIYAEPASELVLEETLKELKGKVLSFYYPWYSNPLGPTNEWCHWEGVTEDSISSSVNYPLLGAYDSNDEDVIRSHMAIAKQAGIDGFIVSWWGIRTHDAKPVDEILELAEEMDLNITFYYESVRDLTEDEIARELAYLIESYADHPAFLMVSGKPVVFVYAVPVYDREAEFWLDVRGRLEENVGPVVLIGDTDSEEFINAFDGFHTYLYTEELARDMETDIPVFFRESVDRFEVGVSTMDTDDLFSAAYSGEDIEMRVKTFLITVTPQIGIGGPDMYKERDSTTYERYWDIVEEIGPHSILITSWNEWHEGTEIEPSREYGFEYINATRRFIEEYKGTPIPEPEVTYTAVVEPFKQNADLTGSGVIMISANGAPALYVNVSVSGDAGVTSLGLEGEFITYVSEQRDNYTSIIIPSVSQQDG